MEVEDFSDLEFSDIESSEESDSNEGLELTEDSDESEKSEDSEELEKSEEETGLSEEVSKNLSKPLPSITFSTKNVSKEYQELPIPRISENLPGVNIPTSESATQVTLPSADIPKTPEASVPKITSSLPTLSPTPGLVAGIPSRSSVNPLSLVQFTPVGRSIHVKLPPGLISGGYYQYFYNLDGVYQADKGVMIFPKWRQTDVTNLLFKIYSGELSPVGSNPLPLTEEVKIDPVTAGKYPGQGAQVFKGPPVTQESLILEAGKIPENLAKEMFSSQPPKSKRSAKTKTTSAERKASETKVSAEPQLLPFFKPSEMIGKISTTSVLQTAPTISSGSPVSVTASAPTGVPSYDPVNREPSETRQEYERRILNYQRLINIGLTPNQADILSRMRNQVDIHGLIYDQQSMQILDAYLPRV